ncbi:uncharacterized protein K02A2.6-like isoform X3 [Photinus pyralis]|uniref:uncharacterized protein K02A2.6-like isoform X3 n=2 Tax=Photinus pyralis TaxID=7054 RepID=UPI001267433F|nr:uncharacterized protein K02A2.6-like isoform X3 [Photinus pyralis]
MANVPPELLQSFAQLIATALRENAGGNPNVQAEATVSHSKPPGFSMSEYRTTDGTTVQDYFKRFDWALELSKVREDQFAMYARVHMGSELNNALKFLVSPAEPETVSYNDLKQTLINHFDRATNKYVESIRFRNIVQQKGESLTNFVLRLKQGAAKCEYAAFLDRMLIEQLLNGLECREMCDEIISKNPESFKKAYEIAHTLEATRNSSNNVRTAHPSATVESTNKLGYAPPKNKHKKSQFHKRSSSRGQMQDLKGSQGIGQNSNDVQSSCNGCGGQHARVKCPFRDASCHTCNKRGHISKVCRKKSSAQSTTNQVIEAPQPANYIDILHQFNTINEINGMSKQMINVNIDGHDIKMELDTGAPCAIMSKQCLDSINPNLPLKKSDRQFSSYTKHSINCIGITSVRVTVGKTSRTLDLYVVEENYDSLFGREWIRAFVNEINFIQLFSSRDQLHTISSKVPQLSREQQQQISNLLSQYDDIFSNTAGKLSGPPAQVHLKADAAPVFVRAREIPLALRSIYAKEIDDKIAAGFFERVDYSEWASPTHVVVKKNGNIRITGNYKPTVNPRMIIDEHPIPKAEHIFARMKHSKLFCHLDITDAYTHLAVDDKFREVLTLNTPTHGLICPTRAIYGSANIPAIWQRRMETVLKDLLNVVNFFDDILVFAESFEQLLRTLQATLDRMRQHGLRLNRSKCVFATNSVEFLGHKIDERGIHKSDSHIRAIRDAPKPSTPEELELFIVTTTHKSTHAVSSIVLEREEEEDGFDNFTLNQIKQLPVRAKDISRESRKDDHLGKIVQLLERGRNLGRYGYKAPEKNYTLSGGCLLFEHRVVIPPIFRQPILNDLHAAHVGIVKMKGIARSFVYWPGIDGEIEQVAKSCNECAKHAHVPPRFREHHWEYPKGPWERVHIDYAGPVAGMMLLILVDAYSKWVEVKVTASTTASSTITILDELFATYGAPVTIVSDNGPQFTSEEFKQFLQWSGVKYHKLSAPYHPSTNGQAERFVQSVKDALKAMGTNRDTLKSNLNEFLRQYRKAPNATTGQQPSLLFLGRVIRSRLDLVRPEDTYTRMTERNRNSFNPSFREFQPNHLVYFLSGNPRLDKWLPGRIITRLGDLHYEIDFEGKRFKRHIDQIRSCQQTTSQSSNQSMTTSSSDNSSAQRRVHFYNKPELVPERAAELPEAQAVAIPPGSPAVPQRQEFQAATLPQTERRSTRIRHAPRRYSPD